MFSVASYDRRKFGRGVEIILMFIGITALFGGGMIYLAFRDTTLRMFDWYEALGLIDVVDNLRYLCRDMRPGDFMLYNLPDLLWIISYLLFVNALIPISYRKTYLFWVFLMPILAIGHEIMQAFGLANGKFDVIDLSCYIVPLTINLIYYRYEKKL